MDKQATTRLMQFVAIAIGAWVLCRLVTRIDPRMVVLLCVLAGSNAAACWALRYSRVRLAFFYGKPVLKQYIDLVCWLSRQQPPIESLVATSNDELILREREDVQSATEWAQTVVRGHDELLFGIFDRLRQTIQLRQRRADNQSIHSPLASFFIAGDEGVGKRYLAYVVAQSLFRHGSIVTFECQHLGGEPVATLFGSKGSPGQLLSAVKRQPYQVIVLERIESAPAALIQHILPVLQSGCYSDPDSGSNIVFQNCVFFFTTAKSVATLTALQAKTLTDRNWHQQAIEALTAETPLDFAFLNALTDIYVCRELDDLEKAQVVAMLLRREAEAYGITLTSVDPEIVVSLVSGITPTVGFGALPDRIRKLMHEPLVHATERNETQMALKVGRRTKQKTERPHEQRIGSA